MSFGSFFDFFPKNTSIICVCAIFVVPLQSQRLKDTKLDKSEKHSSSFLWRLR